MESKNNFDKITVAITDGDKYENVVHDVCHVPNVTNLKEFYKIYELEEKAIEEKYNDRPKVAPTIELFAEAFKKFEEYPSNLQRTKKASIRERFNSNVSKSSPTLSDSTGSTTASSHYKENSLLSLSNLNKPDDIPPASETLSNFVKFQKQVKQLHSEIVQQDLEKEYATKLKQLNMFAQNLEKLLPTEKVGKSALTPEEESIIENLVKDIDDLNFIRNHRDVFRQPNVLTSNTTPKLENLVDILSHCLLAVNSFNIN